MEDWSGLYLSSIAAFHFKCPPIRGELRPNFSRANGPWDWQKTVKASPIGAVGVGPVCRYKRTIRDEESDELNRQRRSHDTDTDPPASAGQGGHGGAAGHSSGVLG